MVKARHSINPFSSLHMACLTIGHFPKMRSHRTRTSHTLVSLVRTISLALVGRKLVQTFLLALVCHVLRGGLIKYAAD